MERDEYGRKLHEKRLHQLTDLNMNDQDPWYHATVAMFRGWLIGAEMAMEDEDIDERVIERVLNRMVFATPNGADAYERVDRTRRDLELELHRAPQGEIVNLDQLGLSPKPAPPRPAPPRSGARVHRPRTG